jgi:hypothetical protein
VQRILRGGGAIEPLAAYGAFALAVDGTHVYVLDNHGGELWRMPKTGGTPEVLATGLGYPWDLALDAVAVYWSSEGDATVGKIAK